MAGAWLRVCQDLLRTGGRLRLRGVYPGRLSRGTAFSSSLIPLTQLRYRSDSTATSASIQNPKVVTTGRVSEGDEGVANSPHQRTSLNDAEIAKFSAIAETWWDFEGPFKPLHMMNPTRLSFIRSALCRHFRKNPFSIRPFEGLKIIDVGCGGGILSEPLARMGACVTGIDAVEKNINVAQIHAGWDPLTSSIEYICTTAEKLVRANKQFDAVLALEVIEHVADSSDFCESLSALIAPGGATVISTINRSVRAYATAIVAAEYLLNWLPRGTHQWSKFLTPEELVLILQRASISVEEMAGFVYNPLTGEWSLSDDTSVNFIAFGVKGTSLTI
ncbi:ubiquinone biosynthesis O-methyltransferase, mitochondrial [Phalaenopsis equestris]|uniref:ubiquinone biosynthesis O-methyltransferase, mitochondrial n=1 Tax=Phalaenopsis equestris TaxID=78828 RepID=UPI0009E24CA0|nr:ubiquinone biosynthesis O-methyltransferase, mitochondrial [Phalaenopsis equestris]